MPIYKAIIELELSVPSTSALEARNSIVSYTKTYLSSAKLIKAKVSEIKIGEEQGPENVFSFGDR